MPSSAHYDLVSKKFSRFCYGSYIFVQLQNLYSMIFDKLRIFLDENKLKLLVQQPFYRKSVMIKLKKFKIVLNLVYLF